MQSVPSGMSLSEYATEVSSDEGEEDEGGNRKNLVGGGSRGGAGPSTKHQGIARDESMQFLERSSDDDEEVHGGEGRGGGVT